MKNAGIYIISFTGVSRIYIGSTTDFGRRKSQHLWQLRRDCHTNPKLQNYYNKYGEVCFNFTIVECILDEDYINQREQEYFNQYFAQEYITSNFKDLRFDELLLNVTPEVGITRTHWTEDRKNALSERNRNFTWTDEMKLKMSNRKKGTISTVESSDKKREAMKKHFSGRKIEEGRYCGICNSQDVSLRGLRLREKDNTIMQRFICNSCGKLQCKPKDEKSWALKE